MLKFKSLHWQDEHDCQDHLYWVEQEEFDGDNDVYINGFWVCEVCGDAVEPEPGPIVYDDYRPLDKG